jgi:CheY-like chemotaxis protein
VGFQRRRFVRIAGPFQGVRVGFFNKPVGIYDINEGGCFVKPLSASPTIGRQLTLKIRLPDDRPVKLEAHVLYEKPDGGFAVSFVNVPTATADRLRRTLLRLHARLPACEQNQLLMLPACPRCGGTTVVPLGMAASTLPWFTCQTCESVWPLRDKQPDQESAVVEPPPSGSTDVTVRQILIADDDSAVLRLLARALSGYRVIAARNVSEAWTLGRGAALDLLITDYLMPDGTGDELITRLRQTQPRLKVLVLSGHGDVLAGESMECWKEEHHLTKPCSIDEIRTAVTALIGPPSSCECAV